MIFTRLAVAVTAIVALLAGAALGGAAGHWWGQRVGAEDERGRAAVSQVESLTRLIESHRALVDAANRASGAMRQALKRRAEADDQSTQELRHALAVTADLRGACRFDDDVMRRLATARDRAAAAAAGGVLDPMPAAAGASEPAR